MTIIKVHKYTYVIIVYTYMYVYCIHAISYLSIQLVFLFEILLRTITVIYIYSKVCTGILSMLNKHLTDSYSLGDFAVSMLYYYLYII